MDLGVSSLSPFVLSLELQLVGWCAASHIQSGSSHLSFTSSEMPSQIHTEVYCLENSNSHQSNSED